MSREHNIFDQYHQGAEFVTFVRTHSIQRGENILYGSSVTNLVTKTGKKSNSDIGQIVWFNVQRRGILCL